MAPDEDTTIRIVVADDHAIVRRELRQALETETGLEVVAEATLSLGTRSDHLRYALEHRLVEI